MFCPRCSQEQISDETKFCSRCGFPLGLVSQILANGGFLPALAELSKGKKLFSRRNGLVFSLFWFMFFVLILTPFFGIMDIDELAGMCAILGSMGGFILLISSLIFLKKEPKNLEFSPPDSANAQINNLYQANQTALPPQQSQPAQNYVPPANVWKAPDTGDLAFPHSVTEGTTKLLKKEES